MYLIGREYGENNMNTGELMVYVGIGLIVLAVAGWICSAILFSKSRDKVMKKIYNEGPGEDMRK